VRSSNAGQCLFSGIADEKVASRLVKNLLADDMFSGWGIRTLSMNEKRFNPMSYHNGSVWPHDVALIASGFARYGFRKEAMQLTAAMFDASLFIEQQRLPELFCGFQRRKGEGPTAYPVAMFSTGMGGRLFISFH
jgi:glycogen debranching enzyme